MIRISNLSLTIGTKEILKDISCTIEQHDFIVILGNNGAGKSTFFDIISGRRLATTGEIIYQGEEITRVNEVKRAQFIARMYQNPRTNVISELTVEENFSLSMYKGRLPTLRAGVNAFPPHIVTMLEKIFTDIPKLLKTKMRDLSGGQQQIIAALLVTLHDPALLLLDEPTAALDPRSSTEVLQFFRAIIAEKRITTLFITHDPQLAIHLGNKIWILEAGRVVKKIDKRAHNALLKPSDLLGTIEYENL